MIRFRTVLAAAAVLAAFAAPATIAADEDRVPLRQNDDGSCGVKLVLKNPDLQERGDGFIYASGWFFIQFQAVGAGAENVKTFTFSFGKALPDGYATCSTPVGPVTGAYIQDYRGDYTPEDGFFVPINTTLVRDDEYGAAVHAYDSNKREIGRFYVKAKTQNGCQMMQCRDRTTADIIKMDKVMPWPRILPGDGVQTNKDVPTNTLTIEFAESVRDVKAYVNGNETPLAPWAGVPMDDDAIPGNDNQPCGATPGCVKRVWGPAFKSDTVIKQDDVVRVVATDLNGNRVEKILHLLDPSQGGIVSGEEINIDISVDNSTKEVSPGQEGEFVFTFISVSSEEAHVNLPVEFDEGNLTATFTPNHVVVKPGERAKASLYVHANADVTDGTFLLLAKPTWRSAGADVTKEFPLSFVVGSGQGGNLGSGPAESGEGEAQSQDEGEGVPGAGLVAVALALAAGVALVRRRT